jgi:hypothetical protein
MSMTEKKTNEPSFSEVYLKDFIRNNSHAEVSVEGDNLIIDFPWAINDSRLKSDVNDQEFITEINKVSLNPKYDAIFHLADNKVEFIFSYIDPDSDVFKDMANREFTVHFEGKPYKCYFSEPTSTLNKIALTFERLPSDTGVRSVPQIIFFRDGQQLEEKSERVNKYFEGKVPRCFFIESKEPFVFSEFENLCKQINFLMSYYDRNSPLIEIHPDVDQELYENKKPIRYSEGAFPDALIAHPVDDIVLKLIEVARTSTSRFSFLYYYQVFEYAGYYYIDDNAKKQLRKFLKDPALINCGEEKVSELFSIFSDINHNDDVKMKKVIEDYCDPCVLWREVNNDKEFFSEDHEFEGGFSIKALISTDTTEEAWSKMWMPKLYDHLTKIRNSLVHARERRENKVILPSTQNNARLRHYIPLIQRVAEQIALRTP